MKTIALNREGDILIVPEGTRALQELEPDTDIGIHSACGKPIRLTAPSIPVFQLSCSGGDYCRKIPAVDNYGHLRHILNEALEKERDEQMRQAEDAMHRAHRDARLTGLTTE